MRKLIVLVIVLLSCKKHVCDQNFKLRIIHFNDFHARFEEVTKSSQPCKPNVECVGGISRLVTTIKNLKQGDTPSLVLNAGDVFQGTVWYTLLKWNVSANFMNMVRADAQTLGNHEFDDGLGSLVSYVKAICTPVVIGNMIIPENNSDNLSKELKLNIHQEPLSKTINGRTIKIIGVGSEDTHQMANINYVRFESCVETVRNQVAQIKRSESRAIIIVLSHCGLKIDKKIAEAVGDDVALIVGGHSHSLLYTGSTPSGHTAIAEYPLEVESLNNCQSSKTLIVQAYSHGMYVGAIDLTFDENGKVTFHTGNLHYQSNDVEKDTATEEEFLKWKTEIDQKSKIPVGTTRIKLDNECSVKECMLGSSFADANVQYFGSVTNQNQPLIAMIHPGTFRYTIDVGNITIGQLLAALPFDSYAVKMTIKGDVLQRAFEHGAIVNKRCKINVLQVSSGIKVSIDFSKAANQRVKIEIQESDGSFVLLDERNEYEVVVNSYMAGGGDGFDMFKDIKSTGEGPTDGDLYGDYVKSVGTIQEDSLKNPRIIIKHFETVATEMKNCEAKK